MQELFTHIIIILTFIPSCCVWNCFFMQKGHQTMAVMGYVSRLCIFFQSSTHLKVPKPREDIQSGYKCITRPNV